MSIVVTVATAAPRIQLTSADEVATAIAQGQSGKALHKQCRARGDSGFEIVIEGPIGRIMRVAREAKGQHVLLTPDDVGRMQGLAASELTVIAQRDRGAAIRLDNLRTYRTSIILKGKQSASTSAVTVVEPLVPMRNYIEPSPFSYAGYKAASTGTGPRFGSAIGDLSARFELAAFRSMAEGDVDVVVFATDVGEQRCTINQRERTLIR